MPEILPANNTSETEIGNSIRFIDRVMCILYAFTRRESELTLKELSDKTGLPKATVYRIVTALKQYDMIHQDEMGVYRLGFGAIRLAAAYSGYEDLRKSALPIMQKLAAISKQTSNLYVLNQKRRLCIQQVLGPTYIPKYSSLGMSHPLYVGASGKVLLAFMPENEYEKYIEEVRNTVESQREYPFDEDGVREAVIKTRKDGFSCTMAERDHYTASIAAPIFDWSGRAHATITISGPVSDFNSTNIEIFASLVKEAADTLSSNK